MASILFLTLHRPNRSPSQRFRFEQYLPYLKENGFDYDWSYIITEQTDKRFYSSGNYFFKFTVLVAAVTKRLVELFRVKKYDIVFVQRECFMLGTAFFEKQFANTTKLIFDFDDAIWLPNVSKANQKLAFLKRPAKTKEIIGAASLVIAGNTYLANYARQFSGQVMTIPTTIDTIHVHNRTKEHTAKKTIAIGWTGSSTTLKYLKFIEPIIRQLSKAYAIELIVICDKAPALDLPNLVFLPWSLDSEIDSLAKIDIGIMPLVEDAWSNGKCGFKILQYMALAIPTIASPVGMNTEIITDGENGFLANTEAEWMDKLSRLIESAALRTKMGRLGQVTVETKYSVTANKGLYLQAFQGVLAD